MILHIYKSGIRIGVQIYFFTDIVIFWCKFGIWHPLVRNAIWPFYMQKLHFLIFFLFIFRCLYYSIFSHDGTWGNAIITFGTRNRSENENRLIRCLESSESTAGWNRTWLYCSSHDRWLLLQCHYCLVPILPLQLIIGRHTVILEYFNIKE